MRRQVGLALRRRLGHIGSGRAVLCRPERCWTCGTMGHEQFFLVDDREVVVTDDLHARCDGGNGPLGHPVEYLTLEKGGETVCKYCGRRYVHTSRPEAREIRRQGQRYAA